MVFKIIEQDKKQAIFEYDNQITDDFDWTGNEGLVLGESNYFIAYKDGKYAIYEYKDSEIIKITDYFNRISVNGLVSGKSNYFLIRENNRYFTCHKSLDRKIALDLDKFLLEQNKELPKLPLLKGKC